MTTGLSNLKFPFNQPYDDEPEYLYSTMVFQQSIAPVGWVKSTSDNDCMLRIVSNLSEPSRGGNNPISSSFTTSTSLSTSVNLSTLNTDTYFATINDIPVHTHTIPSQATVGVVAFSMPAAYSPAGTIYLNSGMSSTTASVQTTGPGISSAGHSHSIPTVSSTITSPTRANFTFKFKYVDAIIATRYYRAKLDE